MLGHADIGLTVNTYGLWLHPSRVGALHRLDVAVLKSSRSGAHASGCRLLQDAIAWSAGRFPANIG
jgi:hypothetical protein